MSAPYATLPPLRQHNHQRRHPHPALRRLAVVEDAAVAAQAGAVGVDGDNEIGAVGDGGADADEVGAVLYARGAEAVVRSGERAEGLHGFARVGAGVEETDGRG